jgi:hypothetical protein
VVSSARKQKVSTVTRAPSEVTVMLFCFIWMGVESVCVGGGGGGGRGG